jgi:uncharacterized protein involved in oxidation of intracellular sulfur
MKTLFIVNDPPYVLCGTRMDARGFDEAALMAGPRRSSMNELAAATAEADKVLVF